MKRTVASSEVIIILACIVFLVSMAMSGRVYIWESAFQIGTIIMLTIFMRRYRIMAEIWRSVAITATWSLESGEPDDQGLHRNRRRP